MATEKALGPTVQTFRNKNTNYSLSLPVPPGVPTVFDESGQEARGVVGPYLLGETVVLKCISSGGAPSPELTWWVDGQLRDSTFEETYAGTVQNTLTLRKVRRGDLGRHLTCQAKNNDLSMPERAKVTIDLKCELFKHADISGAQIFVQPIFCYSFSKGKGRGRGNWFFLLWVAAVGKE